MVSAVVNIEAIDTKKNVATLKGPEGKIVKVKIQDPKKWEKRKGGRQIEDHLHRGAGCRSEARREKIGRSESYFPPLP